MTKKSKVEDPDWTSSIFFHESFDSEELSDNDFFSDSESFTDCEPDSLESQLLHEYLEYESILDHQNSIFTTNSYEDGFGIFAKYLSQFKTVFEHRPVVSEKSQPEEVPVLTRPFASFLEVILKEESPVKSCIVIEEIPGGNTPETNKKGMNSTPEQAKVTPNTPKSRSLSKSLGKKNSILNYFKPISQNEEVLEGNVESVKRKRTNEMSEDLQENVNPAKKALIMP